MSIKHIIWDWNGTLFDDAWLCVDIMNGMLARRDLPPLTAEKYAEIFDFPVQEYYQRAGWDFERVPFEILSDEFIEAYTRRTPECQLRDGGRAVMDAFHQRGTPQSIVSAAKQSALEQLVSHFGVSGWLVGLRGLADHHARGKLDVGRRWVQELGIPPGEILLVGDTLHDCEMAQELGLQCELIPSGHQSRARLAQCGAPLIDSLAELIVE